jgi:hypothetical protein
MSRSYWLKIGGCAAFLLLVCVGIVTRDSFALLGWPWQGLLDLALATGELLSPFVFIYFVTLVAKLK